MEGYAENIVLKNSNVVFINRILKFHLKKHYFRGFSRERSYCIHLTEDRPPLYWGWSILFTVIFAAGVDAHGAVREEGDTCLASQISRINPGDQWGDRCHNQINDPKETLF